MSKRINLILWGITGLVALILLIRTVNFSIQSNEQIASDSQTISAYLSGEYPKVILLVEPNPRSLVATIEARGTSIVVTEYLRRSGEDWFHININETEAGWVQGEYVSLEKP